MRAQADEHLLRSGQSHIRQASFELDDGRSALDGVDRMSSAVGIFLGTEASDIELFESEDRGAIWSEIAHECTALKSGDAETAAGDREAGRLFEAIFARKPTDVKDASTRERDDTDGVVMDVQWMYRPRKLRLMLARKDLVD